MQDWLTDGEVPETVMSVGHCYDEEIRKMNDLDTVAALLKYKNGIVATVDTCRDAAYGYDQRIEAFGDKGMLTAKNEMTSAVELATKDGFNASCNVELPTTLRARVHRRIVGVRCYDRCRS